jgi:hypothetical protein
MINDHFQHPLPAAPLGPAVQTPPAASPTVSSASSVSSLSNTACDSPRGSHVALHAPIDAAENHAVNGFDMEDGNLLLQVSL